MPDYETHSIATTTHGRVLIRRAQAGPARGVLVGFHGYMENAAVQLQRLIDIPESAGWTVVSVQGLHRFYKGRTQEVVAGWMTREDRLDAIADNVRYVDNALAAVEDAAHGPIVFTGFSQGVATAFRAAVLGARRAGAVIAVGGDVPPELLQEPSPAFPRVLLVRGEQDGWYSDGQMHADLAALQPKAVRVETFVHPAGHEWTAAVGQRAGALLAALT